MNIWNILTMSLLPFRAMNVSVALLSMEGHKDQRFDKDFVLICAQKMKEDLAGLE